MPRRRSSPLRCAFSRLPLLLLPLALLRPARRPQIAPSHPLRALPAIPPNLYYLPHEPLLYCYIPKNACTRFKSLLRKRLGLRDWASPAHVHGPRNGLPRLRNLPAPAARAALADRTVRKFVVVRDPFRRLVSAYQNKIAAPWPDQRADFWYKHLRAQCPALMEGLRMPQDGPLLSMEGFLRCLAAGRKRGLSNEHWRPQTDLCGLRYVRYDRYVRLESLQQDAEELLSFLGWPENVTELRMMPHPVYSRQLNGFFSEEAIALALEYYKEDFEVLGYPRVPQGTIEFYSVFDGMSFQPGFVPPKGFHAHAQQS